jgi:predicted Ser/Thr protein kinase
VTERLAPGVGEAFGGYTVESSLGRGGMGAVFLARHEQLGRNVALKVIAPGLADDDEFRARFLRETQLAASLEHPNVIPIYDAGEIDGVLYLAMRYVDGPSLRTLLRERGALGVAQTLAIARQIGGALDAAHRAGLVHRDVKPANVLLTAARDRAFLCDFGLAKRGESEGLTRAGSFLGTADYAAPEQIEGGPLDGRADVYSLGCVLYHCLAGHAPFVRETEYAVLHAHVAEAAPPLSIAPALDAVISRALAKEPCDRYETAGALADALEASVDETRVAPAAVARPKRRRHWAIPVIVALAAVAVAVAVVVGVLVSRGNDSEAPTASAVVARLEHALAESAASRRAIGRVLDGGFKCRIAPRVASDRLRPLVTRRRATLRQVSSMENVPPGAERAVSSLESVLAASIAADVDYANGFRYAAGCPPTSAYFTAAAKADRRATRAKVDFVAIFNPLAMRFGGKTWTASAI